MVRKSTVCDYEMGLIIYIFKLGGQVEIMEASKGFLYIIGSWKSGYCQDKLAFSL